MICCFLCCTDFQKLLLPGINELVDEVFPPLHSGVGHTLREEYNDFTHWRLSVSLSQKEFDDPELVDIYSIGDANLSQDQILATQSPGHLARSLLGD